MQESCTCGSVRGALGNLRPYRDTTTQYGKQVAANLNPVVAN